MRIAFHHVWGHLIIIFFVNIILLFFGCHRPLHKATNLYSMPFFGALFHPEKSITMDPLTPFPKASSSYFHIESVYAESWGKSYSPDMYVLTQRPLHQILSRLGRWRLTRIRKFLKIQTVRRYVSHSGQERVVFDSIIYMCCKIKSRSCDYCNDIYTYIKICMFHSTTLR